MQKFTLSAILAALIFLTVPISGGAKEKGMNPGGFSGPMGGFEETTAKAAQALPDNTRVMLVGNIINQMSKDDYTFRDASGEIKVDISKKRFQGQNITPETKVRIFGKVDKDFGEDIEIEVKKIEIMQ